MGLQGVGRGSRSPAPIPPPLPWWQDTLAINRHYRRLTRMIFTTLVMESNDPEQAHAEVSLDLARRLLLLASPASVKGLMKFVTDIAARTLTDGLWKKNGGFFLRHLSQREERFGRWWSLGPVALRARLAPDVLQGACES
eukprot:s822_g13.t1